MKKLLILVIIVGLFGCSGDSVENISPDNTDPKNINENPTNINLNNSLIQKGPFVAGSSILIVELNENLESTSTSYNTETIDDFGSFEFNSPLNTDKIDIVATGFYFNEITGKLSSGQVTLRNFLEIQNTQKANINILTTLSRQRIKYLMTTNSVSFNEAKDQAEKEVLLAFKIPQNIIDISGQFQDMDISKEGTGNAILLAISCVLQGNNSDGELSELITKFANDLENDGIVETSFVLNKMKEGASFVNPETVSENLIQRFESLGVVYSIPNFKYYIDFDGNGIIYGYDVTPKFPFGEIENTKPTFQWNPSDEDGESYDIQLSENSDFTNLILDISSIVDNQLISPQVLERGKSYYWRIRLKSGVNIGEWKENSFIIKDVVFSNLSPNGGGEMGDSQPLFSWEDNMLENHSYQFQLATDNGFSNIIEDVSGLITNQYLTDQLLVDNTTYFWRVRSLDENGVTSNWAQESFQFELPIILSGMPDQMGDSTPNIKWEAPYFLSYPPESITYKLQLATDIDFNEIILDLDDIIATNYQITFVLTLNTSYYYRIRMQDNNGVVSEWTMPEYFKFILTPVDTAAIYPHGEISDSTPLFDWSVPYFPNPNYAPESIFYQLQVATDIDFNSIILDIDNIQESQYQSISPFSLNTEYYYRIRYYDDNNVFSDWAWTVFSVI